MTRALKTVKLAAAVVVATTALSAQIVEPSAGTWPTLVLTSGSQHRLAAPTSYSANDGEVAWLKTFMASADANSLSQIAYWDAGAPSYRWIQMTLQEALSRNLAAPLATRAMALVSAAVYDATVAAWDSKYTHNRRRPSVADPSLVPRLLTPMSPSYPAEHAVTAGAAEAVLNYLFPDKAAQFTSLAEEAGRSRLFAGTQYPSDVIAGLELGRTVGAAFVAAARADGSSAVFAGSYPVSAGVWGHATPAVPLAGTWKPWALSAGSEVRPPAPPAVGTAEADAQFQEVKSQTRTNATNYSAWFWQPSFITPWIDTAHRKNFESQYDANPPRAARVYAMTSIAQHDSTIACWDAKYVYLEPRPTMVDSSIVTLFANPNHPGYPSGHACASGGAATVLGSLFPQESAAVTARALDAGLSTFYAGIHTRLDVDSGLRIGQSTGDKVIQRFRESTPATGR
ncbi:MAG: vanadium-dependent haloperoxidase [Bryobacteraceae bacterium]|nr:vanadium-dependent haloperoxidase [Bryobacteraceae bacterium]